MESDLHGGNSSSLSQLETPLHERNTTKATRAMEWLGWSASSRKPAGGWRSALFILGSSIFSAVAYSGIFSNLVIYFKSVWNESTAGAAISVTNLIGTMFLTSIIGAFLGDVCLGRLWTTVLFQAIMLLGCTSFTMVAEFQSKAHQNNPSTSSRNFMFVSLYITALGNGSIQPTLIALAADQFDAPEDKAKMLGFYVILGSVAKVLSLTILSCLETNGRWVMGFWIATAAAGMSILMSVAGAPCSRQYIASGNSLLRIVQVLVAAARKTNVKLPTDTRLLYELSGEESAITGSRKLLHTANLRFLDKAAIISDEDYGESGELTTSKWCLCTVTQVEEVKCLRRTFPLTVMLIVYAAVIAQTATIFVEQGETMDRHLGRGSWEVPSTSMQVFGILSSALFGALYEKRMVERLRRSGGRKGMKSSERIGAGFVMAIGAMVVVGLLEREAMEDEGGDGIGSSAISYILAGASVHVVRGGGEMCHGGLHGLLLLGDLTRDAEPR